MHHKINGARPSTGQAGKMAAICTAAGSIENKVIKKFTDNQYTIKVL